MVDCRPAGAPPHELAHANGAPPENHNQTGATGDMAAHGMPPASVRASTPATTNAITTYVPNYNGGMNPVPPLGYCAPYCGMKPLVWCGPAAHAHAPPPPQPPVNPHVCKSVQPSGADLPMNDIATLRFYFNLGVDCMWASYGQPSAPPHRHFPPRDLAHEMQQMSLHERAQEAHKHKPQDKPPLPPHKNNAQRPLLGPRFKRGGNNQDGVNQNNNQHQNKGHNNNMQNKGPNNHRRNSHTDQRAYMPNTNPGVGMGGVGVGVGGGVGVGVEECMEPPVVTIPCIPFPPPMYSMPYYVDSEHAMMIHGGYMGYEEGVEYAPVQHFYPPPYPPQHHPDHK